MGSRSFVLTLTLIATFGASAVPAAEDPAFSKDLMATIALQGMPCDKVIDVKRNGDSEEQGKERDSFHHCRS